MSALDLDQLSEYLDGDHNEYGLDFAATHGFLCAKSCRIDSNHALIC
jgi:uncharacterized protein